MWFKGAYIMSHIVSVCVCMYAQWRSHSPACQFYWSSSFRATDCGTACALGSGPSSCNSLHTSMIVPGHG